MREIKFRGKVENDVWKHGSLLKDGPQKSYYIVDNEDGSGREVIENTVGQFTGLKDKNGVEIYEGDIVYVASEDEKAMILWDKESARFVLQFKDWCADFDNYYEKDLEVVGNIWKK